MLKPHRVLLDKVSGYADEAAAFMRRRRHHRREFVRIDNRDGTGIELPADALDAAPLVSAARRILE